MTEGEHLERSVKPSQICLARVSEVQDTFCEILNAAAGVDLSLRAGTKHLKLQHSQPLFPHYSQALQAVRGAQLLAVQEERLQVLEAPLLAA